MIASESAPGLRGGEIPVVIFAVLFGIFMVGMILWDARRPTCPGCEKRRVGRSSWYLHRYLSCPEVGIEE